MAGHQTEDHNLLRNQKSIIAEVEITVVQRKMQTGRLSRTWLAPAALVHGRTARRLLVSGRRSLLNTGKRYQFLLECFQR